MLPMQAVEASVSTSQTCRSTMPRQQKSPASILMVSAPCSLYDVKRTVPSSLGPQRRPACVSSSRHPPDLSPSTSPVDNLIPGARYSFATATRSGRKPPPESRDASCTKDCVSDPTLSTSPVSSTDFQIHYHDTSSSSTPPYHSNQTPTNPTTNSSSATQAMA